MGNHSRDDTKEPLSEPPLDERARKPGEYYYDDRTGYENYEPAENDEQEEETSATSNDQLA
jgi:hypothetical protein